MESPFWKTDFERGILAGGQLPPIEKVQEKLKKAKSPTAGFKDQYTIDKLTDAEKHL